MIEKFSSSLIPDGSILLACSSHEKRCEGIMQKKGTWSPKVTILFRYDDENPKREERHEKLIGAFSSETSKAISLEFTEHDIVGSLQRNMDILERIITDDSDSPIILDISVFTKRHLLMTLRWLDDRDCWDRLYIVYSEPEDYIVSEHMPLSFGISTIQQIPGFCATPDISRPLHLVVFLGYEGDRAMAVYEHIQPMTTTLFITHPSYKQEWVGRTERFNTDIIKLLGDKSILKVDGIDPDSTINSLRKCLGEKRNRSTHGRIICPLGTKPQALGIYEYVRNCSDPPAIIYASPLRHNHDFYSKGIGNTWFLKYPR